MKMKAIIFKEHSGFVHCVRKIAKDFKGNFVFINVDSHSDMGLFHGELSLGNFITHLISQGSFSDVLWIKNDHNDDFNDGVYRFKFWDDSVKKAVCDLENKAYFFDNQFVKNAPTDSSQVNFEVISESRLSKSIFSNRKWLLSIDCDYFSSANPFSEEFTTLKSQIPAIEIEDLKVKYSKIDTYAEWLEFKSELTAANKWSIFEKLAEVIYDEYEQDDAEILRKVMKLISFLKGNFFKEDCLGVLICESYSSGYVNKARFSSIINILKPYMNNLDYFLETKS